MTTHELRLFACVVITSIVIIQVGCIAVPRDGKQTDLHQTERTGVTSQPDVGTKNVTAHFCPFSCTIGNRTTCVPPPCPPPACVDPAKYKPTDCCDYCPNGPDCAGPDKSIIKWKHWKIVDGKNCTCKYLMQPATCV